LFLGLYLKTLAGRNLLLHLDGGHQGRLHQSFINEVGFFRLYKNETIGTYAASFVGVCHFGFGFWSVGLRCHHLSHYGKINMSALI